MKNLLLLCSIFLLNIAITFSQSYRLCDECSNNLGSGFYFVTPDPLKGVQLVASSIGIISSAPVEASDGKKLISGYMPVCVVPMLGLGSPDTSICSNAGSELSSNAYLIDNIFWGADNLNYFKQGIYNEKIKINQIVDKKTEYNIKVSAEKGGIKSLEDEIKLTIYPTIKPKASNNFKINDTNIVCRNTSFAINIKDEYYNEVELDFLWDNGENTSIVNLEINESIITKQLNIKNKGNNSLCDTTIFFHFKPIKPSSNLAIESKDNISELNPSLYEQTSDPFYFNIKFSNYNNDFEQALSSCQPKKLEAWVEFPRKLFVPQGSNFVLDSKTPDKIKLKYSENLSNLKPSDIILKLQGIPILIDETYGQIVIDSLKLYYDGNSQVYSINPASKDIFIKICELDGKKRILKNYLQTPGGIIKNLFPNPVQKDLTITIDKNQIQGSSIDLRIYDFYGNIIYNQQYDKDINDGNINIELPYNISSGNYQILLTNGYQKSYQNFIIMK